MSRSQRNLLQMAPLALLFLLSGCFLDFAGEITPPAVTQPAPPVDESDPAGGLLDEAVAVEVPLHPLSIETLRTRTYPGSDFVIEETLAPGVNYNRYVVSYQSDGLKINAMLTVPQGEKPAEGFPVVIFNHGYIAPDLYRTTERYVAYVDAFARNGYIVVKSDYRGHGSSEGRAESAYGNPGYVIDVLNALASAQRYPEANPDQIAMWGHSMGGYITLRAMVANPDIKAGVIWAGVVASYTDLFANWFGRGGTTNRSGWRSDLIETYGTPENNPAFWDSLSANSSLVDLSGPVQLHHGTGDATVPYSYSTTLEKQIQAAGKPVELFLYSGDDHNIATNRDIALMVSVVFFNQHVAGLYD